MREVAQELDATLIDMRFVKPLDREMIIKAASEHDLLCTIEDGVAMEAPAAQFWKRSQSWDLECQHL